MQQKINKMEENFKRLPIKIKDMTSEQRKEYNYNMSKKYYIKNKENIDDKQKQYRTQRIINDEKLLKTLTKNIKSLDDLKKLEIKYNLCLEKNREIEEYKIKINNIIKEIDLIIKGK